ncbi:MAG: UDP-N-acetylglucosamine 2-epimerase [Rubripirellula sp.]|nr:UDP-N-acetylglucosamine 2-epimerase [Rubripirellula sp.]
MTENHCSTKQGSRRRIGIVTVARSDFGIYLPLLRMLRDCDWASLQLIAAAAHLSPAHGHTVDWIRQEGFSVAAEVPMTAECDTPAAIATSMGVGVQGFSKAFDQLCPDLLVLLGDRFEMHSAACAAVPFQIPVGHIHGGEITAGAIDDAFRHSISKLSHLHFTATESYARRLVCMGAQSENVVVSGAPGLDAISSCQRLQRDELADSLGIPLETLPLAVTFHPETRNVLSAARQLTPLLEVLSEQECPLVISRPNADPGNVEMVRQWDHFLETYKFPAIFADNLGTQKYFSLLSAASAMIGNSSSGIIEAASFALPVVNIGQRQGGRLRPANVIDVQNHPVDIRDGLRRAMSEEFNERLVGMVNPYGDGHASEQIFDRLRTQTLNADLLNQPFFDVDCQSLSSWEAA